MLYFKVRYHGHKQKCSNCKTSIPETPVIGDKSPGQFWVATRISFANGYMNVDTVVACQRCRQLDTWDWFEDPAKRTKPPDDPDGAYVTALWEKRLANGSGKGSGGGSAELLTRAEGVRPTSTGGLGRLRAGLQRVHGLPRA